jgi:hypothetical protein
VRSVTREDRSVSTNAESTVDGRHSFDFFAGTWKAANRRKLAPLDQQSHEWVEFDGEITCGPILEGMGTIDSVRIPDMPGRGRFEGFTLRLFDPESGLWRIWWASTVSKGLLDLPVVGRWHDDENGTFECDDEIDGVPLKVRYIWKKLSATSVFWEQAFSFDGGQTWDANWITDATKVD